jgi:hypothetical protein
LTKELQIISYSAEAHIANANAAIVDAKAILDAHSQLLHVMKRPDRFQQQHSMDSIKFVICSFEKQKMWFENYKNRVNSTMGLVYNLVTQQDAANNIGIAIDMRKDSSSMNAIAALTMIFLPGTFTAV